MRASKQKKKTIKIKIKIPSIFISSEIVAI